MIRAGFEHLLTNPISRRRLFGVSLGAGATAALSRPGSATRLIGDPPSAPALPARYQGSADPFTLGVASGDPLPNSVVIWTRLAPDPTNGGGMPAEAIKVAWEVATDEAFTDVVAKGATEATPELAHSVHVDVEGLREGADYFYRFAAGDALSPMGRTRTAPMAASALDRLRFGFVSCAHYEHGFFSAYRHLAADDVDLVLCLGDYIYEYGAGRDFVSDTGPVRSHGSDETLTLEDYRNRHALYKTDSDLQAAHAAFPWIVTFDDHEVENDYAGDQSENGDPVELFLARRAAAYQAYYEHMPVRPSSMPAGPDMLLYRRLAFGDLVEFNVLDTRQYRSDQPCGGVAARCDAALDPATTMLGEEQEAWLLDGTAASGAHWNVLAQQVMMSQLEVDPNPMSQRFNDDQWDGYPLARRRILDHLAQASVPNPIVLTGDIHTAWVGDLKADYDDFSAPAIATEFVTTSVTSYNPFANQLQFAPLLNPHLRFFDARHGYARVEVTPDRWQTEFRALSDVTDPEATVETVAKLIVEDGKPGAERD